MIHAFAFWAIFTVALHHSYNSKPHLVHIAELHGCVLDTDFSVLCGGRRCVIIMISTLLLFNLIETSLRSQSLTNVLVIIRRNVSNTHNSVF